ncbi:MAG TPA: MFS transporter [Gaiellaceae bacterium]|nr:MFS transporter [Gaiellaceae bacterium]
MAPGAGTAAAIYRAGVARLTHHLGGEHRTRVIVVLACVLGLSGADVTTVGASATELRHGLHISNTDIGLLVAVTSLVGAAAAVPFGALADRVRRTQVLGGAILLWGGAMIWSATPATFGGLLLARVFLGIVTAAAGPFVASLVGDYFPGSERGRVYGFILAGELLGAGFGFAVTGDIAALSWRAAFVVLAIPAFVLAWFVVHLDEPKRGGKAAEPDARATDAQHLVRRHGVEPDPERVLRRDPRRLGIVAAARYALGVRTNLILIGASACGYYFLAGLQTFGVEFVKGQYRIGQAPANLLLLVIGGGAVGGVLIGGQLSDSLLRRGMLSARIVVSTVVVSLAALLFAPALFTRSAVTAAPYIVAAAFCLAAQNPPLDAARLDIMPPLLWGRAEGIRTLVRSLAQALAPLLFGAVSDYVFGGGHSGLKWTFVVMLVPLVASAALLYRALGTYAQDVATAAAAPS